MYLFAKLGSGLPYDTIIIVMQRKVTKYFIGIDEAGRGPLAGPVAVAGVRIKDKGQRIKIFRGIRDSKKLSAKQREEWFKILTDHPKIEWAVTQIWPKVIDRINIARAANLGVSRVYRKLSANYESRANLRITNSRIRKFVGNSLLVDEARHVLLDGGLKLSRRIPHTAIIKGDERVPVISAASIIAKVTRDHTMLRLHKKYPQYGFDAHKGYGTKFHRAMLKKLGRSEVHRKTFKVLDV